MMQAIFLDRDGVINEDRKGGVLKLTDFKFLPNSLKALRILSKTKNKIIVVTNQPWIAKKTATRDTVENIIVYMKKEVAGNGGRIDAVYYCPHSPEDNCSCRKPKPGMFLQAAKDFGIDLKESVYVGDSTRDIKAGSDLGMKTILVKTGNAGKDGKYQARPDYVAEDLLDATKTILKWIS